MNECKMNGKASQTAKSSRRPATRRGAATGACRDGRRGGGTNEGETVARKRTSVATAYKPARHCSVANQI